MKKRTTILTLTIIALLAINLSFTIADQNPIVNVTRPPIIKNETANTTTVRLNIISSENVLAIKETLIPEDCEILGTYSEPEIDILEVNENEQTWIVANRSETLIVDIYYILTYECDINNQTGEVFILTENDELVSGIFDDDDDDTPETPNDDGDSGDGNGGSGDGSTGDSTTTGLQSIPIQQAETKEEFNEIIEKAAKNILGLDESKEVDTSSLLTWLVLAFIVAVIIITLAYFIIKKPNDFPQQTKTQNTPQPKRPVQTFK